MGLRGNKDFGNLWAAETVSQFGTTISYTVIPLLAARPLAATPFEMGLLMTASTVAFLLIGLPAGVWVDRMRRKPLMVSMDVLRAALMLSVPVAGWLGVLTLAQLIVVALAVGVATVFFDIAYQSYLPTLVGRENLVEGNSKLQASTSVADISGPGLGGWVSQFLGAANGVLATGLGYLGSALFLVRIRAEEPRPERHEAPHLRREVMEGLRFVFGNRTLRAIIGTTSTANLFHGMQYAVQVLFLVRVIGLTDGQAGLMLTAGGIGGVLGAATAHRMGRWLGQARLIWLAPLVTGPFLLLLPLASPGWQMVLAGAGVAINGYGVILYNVGQVSYRQAICPDHLLGRMNASVRWVVWGSLPLGSFAGGVLATWIGVHETLWVSVIGGALSVGWVFFSPVRTMRDIPEVSSVESHG